MFVHGDVLNQLDSGPEQLLWWCLQKLCIHPRCWVTSVTRQGCSLISALAGQNDKTTKVESDWKFLKCLTNQQFKGGRCDIRSMACVQSNKNVM